MVDTFNARGMKIGDDFIRLDVASKIELKMPMGDPSLQEFEDHDKIIFGEKFKELAGDISVNKPHLILIYNKRDDKYYGPYVGPSVPMSDIPGLQEALGFQG